jgi:hypothetical protein
MNEARRLASRIPLSWRWLSEADILIFNMSLAVVRPVWRRFSTIVLSRF